MRKAAALELAHAGRFEHHEVLRLRTEEREPDELLLPRLKECLRAATAPREDPRKLARGDAHTLDPSYCGLEYRRGTRVVYREADEPMTTHEFGRLDDQSRASRRPKSPTCRSYPAHNAR